MDKRYLAQTILPEISTHGQAKLTKAKVLCIGCGGLAATVLPLLVAAGVGELCIIDDDLVSASNLNRQTLFNPQDINQAKALVACNKLRNQNPLLNISANLIRFDFKNAIGLSQAYDLILDCSDNYLTKLAINYAAIQNKIPWVYASVLAWDGQVALLNAKEASFPCYKCWQIKAPPPQSCSVSGVLGASVALIAAYQASLALHALLDNFANANYLFTFDLLSLNQHKYHLQRRNDCHWHNHKHKMQHIAQISWHDLQQWSNYQLIDIRELARWEQGHLANALHLPIGELLITAVNLFNKTQALVIYCDHENLSLIAVDNLEQQGFNAYMLQGGFSASFSK